MRLRVLAAVGLGGWVVLAARGQAPEPGGVQRATVETARIALTPPDRFQVIGRSGRKTCFDNIHSHARQRPGYFQLLR